MSRDPTTSGRFQELEQIDRHIWCDLCRPEMFVKARRNQACVIKKRHCTAQGYLDWAQQQILVILPKLPKLSSEVRDVNSVIIYTPSFQTYLTFLSTWIYFNGSLKEDNLRNLHIYPKPHLTPLNFNCTNKQTLFTQNNFVLKQIQYINETTDRKCTFSQVSWAAKAIFQPLVDLGIQLKPSLNIAKVLFH